MKPLFLLLAGPNGSGKSTLAATPEFSALKLDMLNPDDIAKSSPFSANPLIWSGREMHRLIDERISNKKSFAVETTLSGNNHFKTIDHCKSAGFHFAFHFVFVSNVSTSMGRVRARVQAGGHNVPEEDQQRRFLRSFENAAKVAKIADEAHFYYNGSKQKHQLVAQFLLSKATFIADDAPNWIREISR